MAPYMKPTHDDHGQAYLAVLLNESDEGGLLLRLWICAGADGLLGRGFRHAEGRAAELAGDDLAARFLGACQQLTAAKIRADHTQRHAGIIGSGTGGLELLRREGFVDDSGH